jgi:hypothetical protein
VEIERALNRLAHFACDHRPVLRLPQIEVCVGRKRVWRLMLKIGLSPICQTPTLVALFRRSTLRLPVHRQG